MSKAFTSEETASDPVLVRPRPPLPAGSPNYVTRRGLERLREEVARLEEERASAEGGDDDGRAARLGAIATRLHELTARVGSAQVLDPGENGDEVRFGATVAVRGAAGPERRYQIVGVDEADARAGRIAFVSPLARALLGRRVGDSVLVDTPRGEEELEILSVTA